MSLLTLVLMLMLTLRGWFFFYPPFTVREFNNIFRRERECVYVSVCEGVKEKETTIIIIRPTYERVGYGICMEVTGHHVNCSLQTHTFHTVRETLTFLPFNQLLIWVVLFYVLTENMFMAYFNLFLLLKNHSFAPTAVLLIITTRKYHCLIILTIFN